jgi:hypothetical protein
MGYQVAVHTNTGLAHQVKIARALVAGFDVHGIAAVISDAVVQADMHVCMGPWFALDQWRHGNTLYIDRAYWGDPGAVSVHWLQDGEKLRTRNNPPRPHPELAPMRAGSRRIYLCDYGEQPPNDCDYRRHPADGAAGTLAEALEGYQIAAGRRTTALVDAAIAGLAVETDDPHSPVYGLTDREQWITDLAWHNWTLDEIERGAMWAHFKQR